MITFEILAVILAVVLLYHLIFMRKALSKIRAGLAEQAAEIKQLSDDTRFNNQEYARRTELVKHLITKNKSEAKNDSRTNKNEITKLKSQVGRLRK